MPNAMVQEKNAGNWSNCNVKPTERRGPSGANPPKEVRRSRRLLPPQGPILLHPPLQQAQHVDALIEATKFRQLGDGLLAVAEQELQRGAERQGALRPVLQHVQFVVAHAPAAGEVLPVLHRAVVRVQLQPQAVQEVFVVHEVADLGNGRRAAPLVARVLWQLQLFGTV